MTQSNTQRVETGASAVWQSVCSQQDLVNDSGVVVWLDGAQVALFYLPGVEGKNLYAIDNHDPQSGANVIGRGLDGSLKGDLVVASPIYNQHFRLEDHNGVGIADGALEQAVGIGRKSRRYHADTGHVHPVAGEGL